MGVKDEQMDVKRNRKRQRQAVAQTQVTVSDLDAETLYGVLHAILAKGGAIRFGRTRDGGAWAFGIYGDGTQPYTEYVRGGEDVNEYLQGLAAFFNGLD